MIVVEFYILEFVFFFVYIFIVKYFCGLCLFFVLYGMFIRYLYVVNGSWNILVI